ncbi:transcription termination/antitermination protein NusG [Cereibacter johrii]|uniref:transcription termination/antitermination protein NusG n=1 Tax=Cereibacter johrii TaxID=445629 RepID=UPI000847C77A|nr:transcriptional activator RfaH [Cereibacter johrii]ODM43339.1 transcriptional antiterminator [Cereibacter johrii]
MISHQSESKAASWYLVQTKPNAFRMAERNLLRQDFSVFSPTQIQTKTHGTRFRHSVQQLFPGYLFVSFHPELPRWRAINATSGVSRLVTFGGVPSPMPHALISGLRERCANDGSLLSPDRLIVGDRVRIVSGPFADYIATVEQIDQDKRVWLLLNILGGGTRTQISIRQIQKAG